MLGLLLGVAALTKVSALVLLPVGAAMFSASVAHAPVEKVFVDGTIIVVIAVALSAWWYARNIVLYNDLLALDLHAKTTATRTVPFTLAVFLEEFPSFWFSFWGFVRVVQHPHAAVGLYVFHCAYVCWNWWRCGGVGKGDRVNVIASVLREAISFFADCFGAKKHAPRNDVLELIAHAMLVTFIIGTAIGLVRWNLLSHSMQGRLMFTTLPIISMYLAAGLLAWSPAKHRKIVSSVIIGVIGFIALFTALTLSPPLISLPRRSPNQDCLMISNRFGRGSVGR